MECHTVAVASRPTVRELFELRDSRSCICREHTTRYCNHCMLYTFIMHRLTELTQSPRKQQSVYIIVTLMHFVD